MLRTFVIKKRIIRLFLISIILTSFFINNLTATPTIQADSNNQVVLGAYSYHDVLINATKGQAISGDWEATPADIVFPPFLVFIVDSDSFEEWKNSDNLTQAVKRIPSNQVLYLYDPFLITDDIPLDNRRTGTFQPKVPYNDTWYLVFYAGATLIPLTFSWSYAVVPSYLLELVIYGLVGVVVLAIAIPRTVIYIKRKRRGMSYEEEFEKILEEEKSKESLPSKALGSLEELDNEDIVDEK